MKSKQEIDPYERIIRAMTPGLLITVNDSDPTTLESTELEVWSVDRERSIAHVESSAGMDMELTMEEGDPVLKEYDTEAFVRERWPVTTIEIIGIAGGPGKRSRCYNE